MKSLFSYTRVMPLTSSVCTWPGGGVGVAVGTAVGTGVAVGSGVGSAVGVGSLPLIVWISGRGG